MEHYMTASYSIRDCFVQASSSAEGSWQKERLENYLWAFGVEAKTLPYLSRERLSLIVHSFALPFFSALGALSFSGSTVGKVISHFFEGKFSLLLSDLGQGFKNALLNLALAVASLALSLLSIPLLGAPLGLYVQPSPAGGSRSVEIPPSASSVEELQPALAVAKTEKATLEARLSELEAEIYRLKEVRPVSEEEASRAATEAAANQEALLELQTKLSACETTITNLEAAATLHAKQKALLEARVRELTDERTNSEESIRRLSKQVKDGESAVAALEETMKQASVEQEESVKKALEVFHQQKNELQQQLNGTIKENQELKDQVKKLTEDLNTKEASVEELSKQVREREEKLTAANEELKTAVEREGTLNKQLKAQQEDIARLKQEATSHAEGKQNLEGQVTALTESLKTSKASIQQLSKQVEEKQSVLTAAQEQLQTANGEKDHLDQQIKELQKQLKESEQQRTAQEQAHKEKLAGLESRLQASVKALEEAKEKIKELESSEPKQSSTNQGLETAVNNPSQQLTTTEESVNQVI